MINNPLKWLKFYVSDFTTGEVVVKYICKSCGKEMDEPYGWICYISPTAANRAQDVLIFYCNDECHAKLTNRKEG